MVIIYNTIKVIQMPKKDAFLINKGTLVEAKVYAYKNMQYKNRRTMIRHIKLSMNICTKVNYIKNLPVIFLINQKKR